jgi:hypothetical protein
MFFDGGLQLSISSIEFSLFYQDQSLFCPSCGCKIDYYNWNEGAL